MATLTYDQTITEVARDRIATLFDGFVAATGISLTVTSEILSGDRAFANRYARSNLLLGTYDMVAGRASALWPEGADWPADVPRPAPADVPAHLRKIFDERVAAAKPLKSMEANNG